MTNPPVTTQTPGSVDEFTVAINAEVRAELARQRKTQAELARALKITPATAGKRLDGRAPFDTTELYKVAQWLGVPAESFYPRRVTQAASA